MTQALVAEECPDENALLDFASGALTDARRELLEAHIADCADCCLVLGETASSIAPPSASVVPSPDLGSELAGRYELVREIGSGGQAMVYAAFDHQLQREVALKVPVSKDRDRFLREAQLAARLDHPGIVTVYEIGSRSDGSLYSTQRLVRPEPGAARPRTLRDAFSRATTAAARVALIPRLISVAEALGYAHAQSVVHHDLKPENIAIGEHGETVVLDWGLAEESAAARDPVRVRGTPGYMSPEQARGLRGDSRSDVFALGAMLYELLGGRRPDSPAQELRAVEPTVPPALASIAHRALAIDPAARYPDATGFAADLSSWQSGGMVEAYDYALRERIGLSLRRHRLLVRFGAVLATVLLAAATILFFQNLRTRAALAQTLREKGSVAQRRSAWDTAAALYASALRLEDSDFARYGLSATLGHSKVKARVAPKGVNAVPVLATSADGAQLAVGAQDGRVLLYPRDTLVPTRELAVLTDVVRALGFTSDGKRLLAGGDEGRLLLFDLSEHGSWVELFDSTTPLNALVIGPDDAWVAAAFEDGTVARWSLSTHERLASWVAHEHPAYDVAIDPAGTTLASAGWDKTVKLWSIDGTLKNTLTGHTDSVLAVAWSPGGILASASRDTTIRIWPVDGGVSRVLTGHTKKVNAIAWLGDKRLVSTGDDAQVRYWNLDDFSPLSSDTESIDEDGLALEVCGSRVLVAGGRGVIASLAAPPYEVPLDFYFQHFDLDAEGHAVGLGSNQIVRFDPAAPFKILGKTETGLFPREVRLVPGGGYVVTTFEKPEEGNNLYWLPPDGSRHKLFNVEQFFSLAVTPEGDAVAVGASDSTVRMFDLRTDAPTLTLTGHTSPVFDVVFTEDRIFTASYDKTIGIYDRKTGVRRGALTGHWSGVRSFAVSPDGKLGASGGWDKTVRIWELNPPRLRQTLTGHEGYVTQVAFDPTGKHLVSAGWDGRLMIWDVERGAPLVTVTTNEPKLKAARFLGPNRVVVGGSQLFSFTYNGEDPDRVLATLKRERGTVLEKTEVQLVPFGEGLLGP